MPKNRKEKTALRFFCSRKANFDLLLRKENIRGIASL
jgi:hypothetical protein